MVKAVIAAAEEMNAPVMLQTTPSTVKYGTLETYYAIVAAEAKEGERSGVPAPGITAAALSWRHRL